MHISAQRSSNYWILILWRGRCDAWSVVAGTVLFKKANAGAENSELTLFMLLQCVHKRNLHLSRKIRTPTFPVLRLAAINGNVFPCPVSIPSTTLEPALTSSNASAGYGSALSKKSISVVIVHVERFQLDRKARILEAQLGPKSIHDTVYLDTIGLFITQIDF